MTDEKKIARWDVDVANDSYITRNDMDKYGGGEWCKAEDVAKLEAELAEERDECVKWRDQAAENEQDVTRLLAETRERVDRVTDELVRSQHRRMVLAGQNARLREAIAFYADIKNYEVHAIDEFDEGWESAMDRDDGERARKALEASDD